MDESDDDFKELCANFFQRVKKTGSKQVSGERQAEKASNNTQIKNKLKRTKQSTTKSKTLQEPAEKKPQLGGRAPRTKKQGAAKSQESGPAVPVNGEGGVPAPAPGQPVLRERARGVQTVRTDAANISPERAPDVDSQPPLACWTAAMPSPSKPRTADLVLQRMQQFKRADPERLRHAAEECSLEASPEESTPKIPRAEMVVGNGCGPLEATDSDTAVALALQRECGREGVSSSADLEEEGLFFCQMCQKDLSAMTVTRREQHVNRCLDEAERALAPSAPQIPECPICGRPFLTAKSRGSHLKQCAARMEVGPQLLLQAVRLQTAQPEAGGGPPAPSLISQAGGLKRKGAAIKKESQKKRKVSKPEVPSEDLLVAMALSRSEMEQRPAVPALSLEDAFSERLKPGTEKKSRRKKPPLSPPQLLVQDSETTDRQIQDRVAQLLLEEVELSSTPPLPASRICKEGSAEAGWRLQPPGGKHKLLWEGSALAGAWAVESFYAAGLVPPIKPWQPAEGPRQEPEPQEPGARPAAHSSPGASPLSASQKERQALRDLVELAEEGLSTSAGGPAGLDAVPSSLPLAGFVLPPKEKLLERGDHASLSLGLLVADFSAMVNSPHLSDVQFQTDDGEVLYAHKFVLCARCPLLMQYVNHEGFSAVEDGDLTQRVLLSDVSAEAACAFLRHLYTADPGPGLPPRLLPDLCSLALRFGVSDLVHLCEQMPAGADTEADAEGAERGEGQAQSLRALLRAVWADDEEAEPSSKCEGREEDGDRVNEAEMEEIYEFAATQRKLLQERAADTDEDADARGPDSPAGVPGDGQLEKAEPRAQSGPGAGEAPASGEDSSPSPLLPQGRCSAPAGEAAGQPGPCSPLGGSLLHSVAGQQPERASSSAPGEAPELAWAAGSPQEQSGPGGDAGAEMAQPAAPPRCLLAQAPGSRRTGHLSPAPSRAHGAPPWAASPGSPPAVAPSEQKRGSSVLRLLTERGHRPDKGGRAKGVQISPEKSPPIDLTQPLPEPSRPPSWGLPAHASGDPEVILLLDSDEERELERARARAASNEPPGERNLLEFSPASSELFSVINLDAEQECAQSPGSREAGLQPESRALRPWLLGDREGSPGDGDGDSAADASWLVPASPLPGGSRHSSAQTQITSLGTGAPAEKAAREAVHRLQPSSPVTPGTSHGARRSCGSPSCPGSRRRERASPPAVRPMARARDVTNSCQALSPPGPRLPRRAAASEVVEVGDSEDEQGAAPCRTESSPGPVGGGGWHVEPLSPIPIDHLNLERTGPLHTSSPSGRAGDWCFPGLLDSTPSRIGAASPEPREQPWPASPGSSKLSFLNPALWDDWSAEEQGSPEPPGARHAPPSEGPGTPGADRKNLPPKEPITPMPRYSIMETPVLKKELDRFGVRPLPKRQMVLKLKEIFQYTHQTLESDSEDEIQSSQASRVGPSGQALTAAPCRPPGAGGHPQLQAAGAGAREPPRRKGAAKTKGPRRRKQQPSEGVQGPGRRPATETAPGPDGDTQLSASQGSMATSVDSSSSSCSSQSSSSCEFGAALESAGEAEEAEEGVSASQAVGAEEAVRRYIRSRPALYRRVLTYQPLELAGLQAELRQDGVRVAAGKLLDALDAHCITFTTAAARRERLTQRGRRAGRKKGQQD